MAKDCIDILKENMASLVNDDDRESLNEIYSREIEIPISNCFNVDENPYEYCIDDYMTEETRKILLGE